MWRIFENIIRLELSLLDLYSQEVLNSGISTVLEEKRVGRECKKWDVHGLKNGSQRARAIMKSRGGMGQPIRGIVPLLDRLLMWKRKIRFVPTR